MRHCMIDIETLSLRNDAVVLSVAAVPFDEHEHLSAENSLIISLHIGEQLCAGRWIDSETVRWWMTQPAHIRRTSMMGDIEFQEFASQFQQFLACETIDRFWCKGPEFDAAVLRSLYRSFESELPISHKHWRDVRTICEGVECPEFAGDAHDPYGDCVSQILHVQKAWEQRR